VRALTPRVDIRSVAAAFAAGAALLAIAACGGSSGAPALGRTAAAPVRVVTASLRPTAGAAPAASAPAASASPSAATAAPATTAPPTVALPAHASAPAPVAGGATVRRVSSVPQPVLPLAAGSGWSVLSSVAGVPVAWIATRSGVTLVRFDQHRVRLALHAGTVDPGGSGWRYGPAATGSELHHLVAGFNGGFRFSTDSGGFLSYGRVGKPLQSGFASIVTYRDGATAIGAWRAGVPQRGRAIASVRQNLSLLVNHGVPAATVDSCVEACWGATLGGVLDVARAALGVDGRGQLIWAAGESLSVAALARTMAAAGVQRAVELDINPDWVAGYVYRHHAGSAPVAVPVVPGQFGVAGHFLAPYGRDFFTVLSR
jgi:hypothetical protein